MYCLSLAGAGRDRFAYVSQSEDLVILVSSPGSAGLAWVCPYFSSNSHPLCREGKEKTLVSSLENLLLSEWREQAVRGINRKVAASLSFTAVAGLSLFPLSLLMWQQQPDWLSLACGQEQADALITAFFLREVALGWLKHLWIQRDHADQCIRVTFRQPWRNKPKKDMFNPWVEKNCTFLLSVWHISLMDSKEKWERFV